MERIEENKTMNEIPIYTIIKIAPEEAEIPKLTFYLKEDDVEETEEISMEENLGMLDDIDPLSQIPEADPRQWQMEWMNNYMDALEELDDSTIKE